MKKRYLILSLLLIIAILVSIPVTANAIVANENQETVQTPKGVLEVELNKSENVIKENIEKQNSENSIQKMRIAQYSTLDYNTTIYGSKVFRPIVYADNKYDYYVALNYSNSYQQFEILQHDILNNKRETVYTSGRTCYVLSTFVKDKIIYIAYLPNYVWGKSDAYNKLSILKYNTETKQATEMGSFDVISYEADYYRSFAVDSKERFYFVSNYSDILVYDNKSQLVSKLAPGSEATAEIVINGISPNDKALFYSYNNSRNTVQRQFMYKGIQQLNDGKFTHTDAYTVIDRNLFDQASLREDPKWQFLSADGTYAVNQYGQIAKFNYNENNPMGLSYQIILDLERTISDSFYNTPADIPFTKIGDYYYIAGDGNIIFLVDSQFNKVKKIDLNLPSKEQDNVIARISSIGNTLYVRLNKTVYVVDNAQSQAEDFTTITYSTHSTQEHTKSQIKQQYTKPLTHDYNTSMFTTEPLANSPYRAGVFKQAVVDDTLNKINFFRWLYGINSVTVNESKMERNQKGAVLLAKLKELTHWPGKPNDMDETFYNEAYAGCNAGVDYSGNCSYGDRYMYKTISGYIDEMNNVSGAGIGHRLSLLDPYATQTSFGYCDSYSTLSMYINNDYSEREEPFYAYPSVGNFPSEEMYTDEYWHLYIGYNVYGTFNVYFIYDGKKYKAESIIAESSYPAIDFKLPAELINKFGGAQKKIPSGTNLEVRVEGLTNSKADSVIYDYKVNFFTMDRVLTDITLNKTNTSIIEGKTEKLTLTLNPTNAIPEGTVQWKSDNTQVATVDGDGTITAIKQGTAKITVTLDGITKECNVTVREKPPFQLGDVNEDGIITTEDARDAVEIFLKINKNPTETQRLAADVNKDGIVTTEDARKIVEKFLKIIDEF